MLLTSDQESLFSFQGLNLTTTALPTVHLSFTCHTLYVRQGFFILHTENEYSRVSARVHEHRLSTGMKSEGDEVPGG